MEGLSDAAWDELEIDGDVDGDDVFADWTDTAVSGDQTQQVPILGQILGSTSAPSAPPPSQPALAPAPPAPSPPSPDPTPALTHSSQPNPVPTEQVTRPTSVPPLPSVPSNPIVDTSITPTGKPPLFPISSSPLPPGSPSGSTSHPHSARTSKEHHHHHRRSGSLLQATLTAAAAQAAQRISADGPGPSPGSARGTPGHSHGGPVDRWPSTVLGSETSFSYASMGSLNGGNGSEVEYDDALAELLAEPLVAVNSGQDGDDTATSPPADGNVSGRPSGGAPPLASADSFAQFTTHYRAPSWLGQMSVGSVVGDGLSAEPSEESVAPNGRVSSGPDTGRAVPSPLMASPAGKGQADGPVVVVDTSTSTSRATAGSQVAAGGAAVPVVSSGMEADGVNAPTEVVTTFSQGGDLSALFGGGSTSAAEDSFFAQAPSANDLGAVFGVYADAGRGGGDEWQSGQSAAVPFVSQPVQAAAPVATAWSASQQPQPQPQPQQPVVPAGGWQQASWNTSAGTAAGDDDDGSSFFLDNSTAAPQPSTAWGTSTPTTVVTASSQPQQQVWPTPTPAQPATTTWQPQPTTSTHPAPAPAPITTQATSNISATSWNSQAQSPFSNATPQPPTTTTNFPIHTQPPPHTNTFSDDIAFFDTPADGDSSPAASAWPAASISPFTTLDPPSTSTTTASVWPPGGSDTTTTHTPVSFPPSTSERPTGFPEASAGSSSIAPDGLTAYPSISTHIPPVEYLALHGAPSGNPDNYPPIYSSQTLQLTPTPLHPAPPLQPSTSTTSTHRQPPPPLSLPQPIPPPLDTTATTTATATAPPTFSSQGGAPYPAGQSTSYSPQLSPRRLRGQLLPPGPNEGSPRSPYRQVEQSIPEDKVVDVVPKPHEALHQDADTFFASLDQHGLVSGRTSVWGGVSNPDDKVTYQEMLATRGGSAAQVQGGVGAAVGDSRATEGVDSSAAVMTGTAEAVPQAAAPSTEPSTAAAVTANASDQQVSWDVQAAAVEYAQGWANHYAQQYGQEHWQYYYEQSYHHYMSQAGQPTTGTDDVQTTSDVQAPGVGTDGLVREQPTQNTGTEVAAVGDQGHGSDQQQHQQQQHQQHQQQHQQHQQQHQQHQHQQQQPATAVDAAITAGVQETGWYGWQQQQQAGGAAIQSHPQQSQQQQQYHHQSSWGYGNGSEGASQHSTEWSATSGYGAQAHHAHGTAQPGVFVPHPASGLVSKQSVGGGMGTTGPYVPAGGGFGGSAGAASVFAAPGIGSGGHSGNIYSPSGNLYSAQYMAAHKIMAPGMLVELPVSVTAARMCPNGRPSIPFITFAFAGRALIIHPPTAASGGAAGKGGSGAGVGADTGFTSGFLSGADDAAKPATIITLTPLTNLPTALSTAGVSSEVMLPPRMSLGAVSGPLSPHAGRRAGTGAVGADTLVGLSKLLGGFPGPLGPTTNREKLLKYVHERAGAYVHEDPHAGQAPPQIGMLMWQVLAVQIRHGTILRGAAPVKGQAARDHPHTAESELIQLLGGGLDTSGGSGLSGGGATPGGNRAGAGSSASTPHKGLLQSISKGARGSPFNAAAGVDAGSTGVWGMAGMGMEEPVALLCGTGNEQVQTTAAAEVQRLLVAGRRADAVKAASAAGLWGLALLLASACPPPMFMEVATAMSQAMFLPGSPLHTGALVLVGKPDLAIPLPGQEMLSPTMSGGGNRVGSAGGHGMGASPALAPGLQGGQGTLLSSWRLNLAVLASSVRSPADLDAIMRLGDRLGGEGAQPHAAQLCYLVAGAIPTFYSPSDPDDPSSTSWTSAPARTPTAAAAAAGSTYSPGATSRTGGSGSGAKGRGGAAVGPGLVGGYCLLGVDHVTAPRTYSHVLSIQRTEALEFALVCGAQAPSHPAGDGAGAQSNAGLAALLPYKLQYAHMLADVGKVPEALSYCAVVEGALKDPRGPAVVAGLPVGYCQLLGKEVDELRERLGAYASAHAINLARGESSIAKIGRFLDNTLTRLLWGGGGGGADNGGGSNGKQGGDAAGEARKLGHGSPITFYGGPNAPVVPLNAPPGASGASTIPPNASVGALTALSGADRMASRTTSVASMTGGMGGLMGGGMPGQMMHHVASGVSLDNMSANGGGGGMHRRQISQDEHTTTMMMTSMGRPPPHPYTTYPSGPPSSIGIPPSAYPHHPTGTHSNHNPSATPSAPHSAPRSASHSVTHSASHSRAPSGIPAGYDSPYPAWGTPDQTTNHLMHPPTTGPGSKQSELSTPHTSHKSHLTDQALHSPPHAQQHPFPHNTDRQDTFPTNSSQDEQPWNPQPTQPTQQQPPIQGPPTYTHGFPSHPPPAAPHSAFPPPIKASTNTTNPSPFQYAPSSPSQPPAAQARPLPRPLGGNPEGIPPAAAAAPKPNQPYGGAFNSSNTITSGPSTQHGPPMGHATHTYPQAQPQTESQAQPQPQAQALPPPSTSFPDVYRNSAAVPSSHLGGPPAPGHQGTGAMGTGAMAAGGLPQRLSGGPQGGVGTGATGAGPGSPPGASPPWGVTTSFGQGGGYTSQQNQESDGGYFATYDMLMGRPSGPGVLPQQPPQPPQQQPQQQYHPQQQQQQAGGWGGGWGGGQSVGIGYGHTMGYGQPGPHMQQQQQGYQQPGAGGDGLTEIVL